MTVNEMRYALKTRTKYSGSPNWRKKVQNMSEAQVIAVYKRMERSGEIR